MGEHSPGDVRRGRPPAALVDTSALDGAQVDLDARLGWMLRASRLAVRPGLNLRDLAAQMAEDGVAVSESTLSRLETGRLRSAPLVAAYERALGLPEVSLQGAMDVACRSVGQEHCRETIEPSIAALSVAVDPVVSAGPDDEVTAADWLAFSDVLNGTDAALLSRRTVQDVVRRLAGELRRSVGSALPGRYEALSTLRCSRYGQVVLEIGMELLDEEGTPPQPDLARALGELPCLPLFQELASRLGTRSTSALEGWASTVEVARVLGDAPLESWGLLVEPLVAAYQDSDDDPWRRMNLAYIVRLMPGRLRREVLATVRTLPDPVRSPADWTTTRRNEHYTVALELARRVCSDVDLPEQPMLGRLIFEALYDPRISRELPAAWLLGGLPFSDVLVGHLVALATDPPDPTTARLVPWLLMRMRTPHAGTRVSGWLGPDDRGLVAALLRAYGGVPVSLDDVRHHLGSAEAYRSRALVALGLAGDPSLHDLCSPEHPDSDEDLARRSRWLVQAGPRITR